MPVVTHLRHHSLLFEPALQLEASQDPRSVINDRLEGVLGAVRRHALRRRTCGGGCASTAAGSLQRCCRLQQPVARQRGEAAPQHIHGGEPRREGTGALAVHQPPGQIERSHHGVGWAGALHHGEPLPEQRAVEPWPLHMQHGAHRQRRQHLVRGLHNAVRAAHQRPRRQRRVLAIMRPVCFIHQQRNAAGMADPREGRKVASHAIVIRHGHQDSGGLRVGCKRSLNRLCRRSDCQTT
ncbi:hypothetical protein D3C73_623830 [compost metagenome]